MFASPSYSQIQTSFLSEPNPTLTHPLDIKTAISDRAAYADIPKYHFGIRSLEVSPIRVLGTIFNAFSDPSVSLSGSVIFNLPNPRIEIAVPFYWSERESLFQTLDCVYNLYSIDVQLRRFSKPSKNGGYVGIVARATVNETDVAFDASYDGTIRDSLSFQNLQREGRLGTFTDRNIGLGIVVGGRLQVSKHFYLSANISFVAMLDEKNEDIDFDDSESESRYFRNKFSVTADILKIGYQF